MRSIGKDWSSRFCSTLFKSNLDFFFWRQSFPIKENQRIRDTYDLLNPRIRYMRPKKAKPDKKKEETQLFESLGAA